MPRLLRLPPGKGLRLCKSMDRLTNGLRNHLPRIFESEAYGQQRKQLVTSLRERQGQIIGTFQQHVQDEGFALIQVQMGPISRPDVLPAIEGEAVPLDQLDTLIEEGKMTAEAADGPPREACGADRGAGRGGQGDAHHRAEHPGEGGGAQPRHRPRGDLRPVPGDGQRVRGVPWRAHLPPAGRGDILENAGGLGVEDDEEDEADGDGPDRFHFYAVNLVVDNARCEQAPDRGGGAPAVREPVRHHRRSRGARTRGTRRLLARARRISDAGQRGVSHPQRGRRARGVGGYGPRSSAPSVPDAWRSGRWTPLRISGERHSSPRRRRSTPRWFSSGTRTSTRCCTPSTRTSGRSSR